MKTRRIETFRRLFRQDESERYAITIRLYVSQAELDTFREKGLKGLLPQD
jgi:hypothetical protein